MTAHDPKRTFEHVTYPLPRLVGFRASVGRSGARLPRAAPAMLRGGDALLLALLGPGPMGGAFHLWDIAMKRGDPRVIRVLAYATPLSTALLIVVTGRRLTPALAAATLLVVIAAILASRATRR